MFTLLNMCEIYDPQSNRVVVLDKVKKEGWEGLTYPGGHLELGELLLEGVAREILEETGLTIHQIEYCGAIHWYTKAPGAEKQLVGMLFRSQDFEGELIEENREGRLFWMDRDDFRSCKSGKSFSMDEILDIYDGKFSEIALEYENWSVHEPSSKKLI
ncbi:MAG: NUDIX domain-containing protein [Eubacteriales bacterium]|nr:NUDIX domain-containing protein [Eubacteriales bacterium]